MVRAIVTLLMLCTLGNAVDAAVDAADVPGTRSGSAHDMHDPHEGRGAGHDDPGDDADEHFCHCAAHMPPLAAASPFSLGTGRTAAPDHAIDLPLRSRAPPPVRPPKI